MTDAPLVTFALFTFNQERYIREAVEAALAQSYRPLEIILSDDCSTDATFAIIEELVQSYRGPHRVRARRSQKNRGLMGHISDVMAEAQGEFVVVAAGDDVSLPERTAALVRRWRESGEKSAVVYSDFEAMDEESRAVDLEDEAAYFGPHSLAAMATGSVRVLGATCAVTRDLFHRFPPIMPCVIHEDRVLPYRALLLDGAVSGVEEPLVRYRVVGGMSRRERPTAEEYLRRHSAVTARRTLPDAVQRLADTLSAAPDQHALRHLCEATVADLEARLDFASARGGYESKLLTWVTRGARVKPLFKHYLKFRFFRLFTAFHDRPRGGAGGRRG